MSDFVPEEQHTIDLKELFFILLKNSWLILGITIAFGVAVGVFSVYGIDKQYESHTLFAVHPQTIEDQNQTSDQFRVASDLAKRYSIIAKSDTVMDEVTKELYAVHQINMSSGNLRGRFTVQPIDNTDILQITVTYTDPEIAQFLADTIMEYGNAAYHSTYNNDNISVIDYAKANDTPVSPRIVLNILIGIVIGGMVSVGLVLFKEIVNKKIRTARDVEQLGIPYLGSIQDLKH